ncbi:helix-turn-helix domain-containing protein [Paraburkholderia caballeronis]|uniref:helix-turn-helix domain-containing protein n=1 Tax=Paraburkholderia caballeronis TaxID=416943 RepID=UPI0010661856|nr:helix-turn-helix transcriptional regulator [Paraburkholderia caballeronis]TDV17243.1 helix-turn-helix protein [Paraburkholderia caballeronis]TDV17628.1 helix-turn-helix protein [Paraburkholderia caballeronis]TDV27646.1 helix-turn-helix protein [Paraburkholderia caballeronis]
MNALVRDFGVIVRRLREARGWSQEQLAEHAGLNRSYVGEIERGTVIASIVTVEKLARAFGVSIADLLLNVAGVRDTAAVPPVADVSCPRSPVHS